MNAPASNHTTKVAPKLSGFPRSQFQQPNRSISEKQRAALELRLRKAASTVDAPRSIPLRDRTIPVPLTFAQEQLWFLEQLLGGTPVYNIPFVFRLRGRLVAEALEVALCTIVRRHEAMRTTITCGTSGPCQRVGHCDTPVLHFGDLSQLPVTGREGEALRIAIAQARIPFDLEAGPLVRFFLWKLDHEDHVFGSYWHHIMADGWSLGIFSRELVASYSASLSGNALHLDRLQIQYGDFAAWQRRGPSQGSCNRVEQYWLSRLAGAPPLLELPTDRPRPTEQSHRGEVVWAMLENPLRRAIDDVSRQIGVSSYMTLLAGFKVLLYRYSGQQDVLVGSPFANRPVVELEKLVGYFANTLVLRTDLSGNPTFADLTRRVLATTLEAIEHQDMPLARLVELTQPVRSPGHHPIFQVQFILQHEMLFDSLALPEVEVEPIDVDTGTAKFDLTLQIFERRDGLRLALEYSTDLWDRSTAARIVAHYRQLLECFLARPDTRIDDACMLMPDERRTMLEEWNDTRLCLPSDTLIHELFEAQVRTTPRRVAVEFDGRALTYEELNAAADSLAKRLRQLGVGPDVLVGLCLERSPEMIVGVLAILKAGGAYVPLDPRHPQDRLGFIIEDSGAFAIVTQSRLIASLPSNAATLVVIDEPYSADAPIRAVSLAKTSASQLAYVLYTSGSTGRPKGVQIEHRAVVNFLRSMRESPGLSADDVVLAVTTVAFDIAGLEIHLPLSTGARVVIVSDDTAADAVTLAQQIDLHGITVLQATPATWRFIIDSGWTGNPRLKALCGGEAMPSELAHELLPRCAELWNMYGPTETTIWSTCCRIRDTDTITIGRPIHNTEVYILDSRLQPVPVGVHGELMIGGEGLARGYHARPELTAEKFIPHPFKPSGRLYRTGDLARFHDNGEIECLGRLDHQVKLRGFRIELGEIESGLAAHAAVAQAVAAVVEAPTRCHDKELVAFIITKQSVEVSPTGLRRHLGSLLPAYMVPARYIFVTAFPLNANGKVDRRALMQFAQLNGSALDEDEAAPCTPLESEILSIWQRVLGSGAKPCGTRTSFFDIGGHSLLAMRLVREIQNHFHVDFPLRRLLEAPTVEKIAVALAPGVASRARRPASDRSFRGSGPAAPLFVIPGLGGFEFIPRGLADRIHGDRQYFDALQMQGADSVGKPFDRIEDIAASLITQIREVRPEGAYTLVGFCFGGLVAYEVARQLEELGESVETLVLWHAFHAGQWRKRSLPEILAHIVRRYRTCTPLERKRSLAEKTRFIGHQARIRLENLRDRALGRENLRRLEGIDHLPADVNRRLVEANMRARAMYRPKPFHGRTYIINGRTERIRHECPPLGGWQGLLRGEVEEHRLTCEHLELLQPPWSEELAGITAACLHRSGVQGKHARSMAEAPGVRNDNDQS